MMANKKFRLNKIYLLISLALTACSGGGGGKENSSGAKKTPELRPPEDKAVITPQDKPALPANGPVKVGVLDSGVNQNLPNLQGKTGSILRYVGEGDYLASGIFKPQDLTKTQVVDTADVAGHGSYVSQIIAGTGEQGTWAGSKNVVLYSAQTTNDRQGHSAINDQLAAIIDLHKKQGVNLFNASWGSYNNYSAGSSITQVIGSLADDNGLIIFSAGNDARSSPSSESLLPLLNKNIEKGLIAVVGVDNNNYLYRAAEENAESKGSNACGQAAGWCMAGNYVVGPLLEYKNGGYVNFYGTSGAAPQVTAAAADVWSKYSWMTAAQVKQTLLTSADYLADGSAAAKPYNATYGWGKLNASRAVNGPARFDALFGDFNARVTAARSTFSNNIAGDAGLIKRGAGLLELAGANTYTGNTAIMQGTLLVNGSINGGTVTVAGPGILSGSGAVRSVNNSGTVDLSSGSLTVKGDYSQQRDGTLNAWINNRLVVSGEARLDGTVNLVNKNYVTDGTYSILQARSVDGKFARVNGSKFLAINQVSYGADSVQLDVTQVSARDAGAVNDALSSAGATVVDGIFSAANAAALKQRNGMALTAQEQRLVAYSASLQSTATDEALSQIVDSQSGVIYAELPSVLLAEQSRLTSTVSARLRTLYGTGPLHSGVWTSQDYMKNKYRPEGWNAVSSTTNNTTIGLDAGVGDDVLLGGFINRSEMDVSLDRNGGSLQGRQTGAGAYARYGINSLYVSGLLSYQRGDADVKRQLIGNGTRESAKSSAGMNSASAYVESGYLFRLTSAVDAAPYAGVEYDRSATDGVSEDHAAAVTVSGMKAQQTSLMLGTRISYRPDDSLQLGGYLQAAKVVSRDLSKVTLASHLGGEQHTYTPPGFERCSLEYGVSAGYRLTGSLQIFASLQNSTANEGAFSASGGLKYDW